MDFDGFMLEHVEWSSRINGPFTTRRTEGILKHIEKEVNEIREAPNDLEEWVDVMMLSIDGFLRHGGTAEQIVPMLYAKLEKNRSRKWPAGVGEDVPMEHVRDI